MSEDNLPYGSSANTPELSEVSEEDENKKYSKKDLLSDPSLHGAEIKKQIFLTKEMKELFLDCALNGKSYRQKFDIIPGKMSVMMKSMTAEEMDKITHTFDNIDPTTSMYSISGSVQKDNLIYSLDSIIISDKNTENFTSEEEKRKYVNNLPQSLYERLIRLNQIFQIYLVCLQEEMFSPDF